MRSEASKHAPAAGADVEQRAQRAIAQLGEQQVAEIELVGFVASPSPQLIRRPAAALGEDLVHAPPVAHELRVMFVGEGEHLLEHALIGFGRGRAVVHPVLFTKTVDEAGVGQELEMTRHARLALIDDLAELSDGELGPSQQREQSQAGGLPCCSKAFHGVFEALRHISRHKEILICAAA
jgi:hypothetical protein